MADPTTEEVDVIEIAEPDIDLAEGLDLDALEPTAHGADDPELLELATKTLPSGAEQWVPDKHPRLTSTTGGQRGGTFMTKANIEAELNARQRVDVTSLARGSQHIAHVQILKTKTQDQTLMLVRLKVDGQQGTFDVGMYVPTKDLDADRLQRVLVGLNSGLPINDLVRKEKVYKVSNDEKHYAAYTQYVRTVASNRQRAVAASEEGGRKVTELAEIFCADTSTQTEDGLIWKVALPVGDLKVHPNHGTLRPFRVIEGKSANQRDAIGLQDIMEQFDRGVVQHVTVPTSHRDQSNENTGYVRKLKIGEFTDAKGRKRRGLLAGLDITEPEIKGKIERGTIANCSVGLEYDYPEKESAAKVPIVLKHVALTNKPFVPGMPGFDKIAASEDGSTTAVAVMESEAPPPIRRGFQWRMTKAQEALDAAGIDAAVEDINEDELVVVMHSDDGKLTSYAIPYSVGEDAIEVAQAREDWRVLGAIDPYAVPEPVEPGKEGDEGQPGEKPPPEQPVEPRPPGGPETPEQQLAEAQARRKLLLSEQATPSSAKGGDTNVGNTITVRGVELTEEQVAKLLEGDREKSVDAQIDEMKKLGLTEETGWSGFLRVAREYMLADNGEPALLLSENGKPKTVTLSEALDTLVKAIPEPAKPRQQLVQQHAQILAGERPPATDPSRQRQPGERNLDFESARERADAFRRQSGTQRHLIQT